MIILFKRKLALFAVIFLLFAILCTGCKSISSYPTYNPAETPFNTVSVPPSSPLSSAPASSPVSSPLPQKVMELPYSPVDFPPPHFFIPPEAFASPEIPALPSFIASNSIPLSRAAFCVIGHDGAITTDNKTYICDGIDDQVEIQKAINNSGSNGTVVLVGSFYLSGPISVPSNITLRGDSNNIGLYLSNGFIGPVITNSDHVNGNTGIILRNIWIDCRNLGANGIEFRNVADSSIINCWVQNASKTSDVPQSGAGIYIAESNDIVVDGCFTTQNGSEGISVRNSCSNISLKGNVSWSNKSHGIFVGSEGGSKQACTNIFVTDNILRDNAAKGIEVSGDDSSPHTFISVIGNILSNNRGGISFINDSAQPVKGDHLVRGNKIYSTVGGWTRGLFVNLISDVNITDNIIKNAEGEGIRINSSKNITISDNIAKDCVIGIYIQDCNSMDIIENCFTSNKEQGCRVDRSTDIYIQLNNIVANNTKGRNYDGILIVGGAKVIIEGNRIHYGHDRAIETSPDVTDSIIRYNDFRYCRYGLEWWLSRDTGDARIPVDNHGPGLLMVDNLGYADETDPVVQATLSTVKQEMGPTLSLWPFSQFRNPLSGTERLPGEPRNPYPRDYGYNSLNLKMRGGNVLYWDSLNGYEGRVCYYTFNGIDENLYYEDVDAFSFGNGKKDRPFSLLAVIRPDLSGSYPAAILSKYDSKTEDREWALRLNEKKLLEVELFDEAKDAYIGRTARSPLAEGKWAIVMVTYDGCGKSSGINIYVNGNKIDAVDHTAGSYAAMHNTASFFRVGCESAGKNAYNYTNSYQGDLTWIGISSSELSDNSINNITDALKNALAEVTPQIQLSQTYPYSDSQLKIFGDIEYSDETESMLENTQSSLLRKMGDVRGLWPFNLFNDPTNPYPRDFSNNGYDLRVRGGNYLYWDSLIDSEDNTFYYTFNGIDENLYYEDIDAFSFGNGEKDTPFSLLAVIRPDLSGSYPAAILSKYNANTGDREWALRLNEKKLLEVELFDEEKDAYIGRVAKSSITDGKWAIVMVTYDGSGKSSGINIYVNGEKVDSSERKSGSYGAMHNTAEPLRLAAEGDGKFIYYKNGYKGDLNWVGISASHIQAEEVQEIYQQLRGVIQVTEILPVTPGAPPDLRIVYNSVDGLIVEPRVLYEFVVCGNKGGQYHTRVSENIVVWGDWRNEGIPDIYGYDILTSTEFPICTKEFSQNSPDIYNNIIVWVDLRSSLTKHDIYGFDLLTDTEFPICTAPDVQAIPVVSGRYVIWRDSRNYSKTSYDIYGYDLLTNTEFPVCTAGGKQERPDIEGNIVVWADNRNSETTGWDIYGYDLSTGTEFPVCTLPGNQERPYVWGGIIVWQDDRQGNHDIYAYNLDTKQEFCICRAIGSQNFPAISGNIVVWKDYRNHKTTGVDIYGYDLITGKEFPICVQPGDQSDAAIWGDIVVWQDKRRDPETDIYGAKLASHKP